MCECGCGYGPYDYKLFDKDGNAVLFKIYSSCDTCYTPAGVDIHKVTKHDFEVYDVDSIPDMDFGDTGSYCFMAVVHPKDIRNKIIKHLVGINSHEIGSPNDCIDEAFAEVIADELFPHIRDEVAQCQKESSIQ